MLKLIDSNVEIRNGIRLNLYECKCGKRKVMYESNVDSGKSRSCGCLQRAAAKSSSTKHGMVGTRIYNIWQGIIGRCYVESNGNFYKYGGKGIVTCDEWRDFSNFYKDMGDPPEGYTIDRIDPSKCYFKENCRWATYRTQSINTKRERNNSSGRVGVSLDKRNGKFKSRITSHGKTISLGTFVNLSDAVDARIEAEIKYHKI